MKLLAKIALATTLASITSAALADVTCTADAGSEGGPYYTVTAPTREEAYSQAYDQALTFVNISDRNPMYISVSCNQ
ncbi:MAG: hypothetical protein FJ146_11110 [Deltaproteobacteria bacterium]|nr:hypothetical protein [Deltaproteobacteria bacterium]